MSLERISIMKPSPWLGEHLHRYKECLNYVHNYDVILDLACGSGYGVNLISSINDTKIFGGDIDESTISQCIIDWKPQSNIFFEVMDATKLRFNDSFFNLIISLETIEHLMLYDEMLSEFYRVLVKGGIAIISTPNRNVSSPDGIIRNPYHTQEFTYDEFANVLSKYFSSIKIFGQKNIRYYNKKIFSVKFYFEKLLLMKGIRKINYRLRNFIFKKLFKDELYASEKDFILETDITQIKTKCNVLFAVCYK